MSNLFKSNYVVNRDEKRVIDSNELIAVKLSRLSEIEEETKAVEPVQFEEFSAGLNAEQLELLLDDNPERAEQQDEEGEYEGQEEYEEQPPEEVSESAREIIENARAQAQEIIDSAEAEADSIRQKSSEQGYDEGFMKGQEEALTVIDEEKQKLELREAELNEEYDKKLEEMEPLLVDTITDIFEHIFHVSLSSNREIMLNLLHDTVRNVEGCKNFIIHVSKSDFEFINDRKDQLMDGLGSTDTIEVIEDLTLRQSECFIEAEGGIYDCGIGTELELLKKELMLLSYQKG